jgi:hypothetical protein
VYVRISICDKDLIFFETICDVKLSSLDGPLVVVGEWKGWMVEEPSSGYLVI